jgi:hypothetical protein
MAGSDVPGGIESTWRCSWCGGGASDEQGLLDHQEWCLGDGRANVQLMNEVAGREGELTQEALVAAARQRRQSAEGNLPNG